MKKILAVDGNSIINRAFYGIRALTTADGLNTNALYGMINIIEKQVALLNPDYCVMAFDLKEPTFRHKMYDGYKAGRRPMPPELAEQFPIAKECASALGFSVLEKAGYEADDILGTIATMADREGYEAYIMTGDRDSLQLIDPNVHVLLATNTDTIDMSEEKFKEKYGVLPSQFVDVKALMGDSSDNIPGVAGIGEKTALKLIEEYGSLDRLYERLPEANHTPSLRAKLENGKDSAYMSKKLSAIFCEVPLDIEFADIEYHGIDRARTYELFKRLEFSKFIDKFGLSAEQTGSVESENEYSISDKKIDSIATGVTVSVSFDGEKYILFDGENIYYSDDVSAEFIESHECVCYDCKNLYHITGKRNFGYDVMLGAYVVDSNMSGYDMPKLVSRILKKTYSESISDVVYIYELYPVIKNRISESGESELMEKIEMPLAEVLCDMEEKGFYIDRDGIKAYGEKLAQTGDMLAERIYVYAGGEFNINSPKQLGEVLFERLCLPSGKKTKTGYSTNAEVLEKLRPYHPIIDDILEYRKVAKLKSTYVDGLLKAAGDDGRVHTNFKQTGTATGRLSSTEPNLQNIPIRTELGRELRKYFLPKNSDYVLLDADYSQIELRLLAHISGDQNMIDAFRSGEDIHTSTAAAVFGVDIDSVTPELRKRAKAVNFGIVYGIGDFSLSQDLGISRMQAKKYIESYLASYPAINRYLNDVVKEAKKQGYVTTMLGRRRYIPELSAQNKNLQHFGERIAMNSPIQGSAADIIKIAMINVHRRLVQRGIDASLILQVHDELLIEANKNCADEAMTILVEEMENAVSISVPLEADAAMGENWFDAK